MAGTERLIQAGTWLNGQNADGEDRLVTYTHEVIAGHKISVVRNDVGLVKKRITAEEMFKSSTVMIRDSALRRFDEIGLSTDFVANIAESELDPTWVLGVSARRTRAMAELLVESRVLVLAFQKMELDIANAAPGIVTS